MTDPDWTAQKSDGWMWNKHSKQLAVEKISKMFHLPNKSGYVSKC